MHERGLQFVLDIVPNHVGVAGAQDQPVVVGRAAAGPRLGLRRLLRHRLGRRTDPAARSSTPTRRRRCRSSGCPRTATELRYYEHAFPVAPGTADDGSAAGGAPAPALPAGVLAPRRAPS